MFWKALETRSTDFPREVSLKTSSSFNHRTKSRNRTEHQYTFLYHNSLWTIIRLHTYHCTINSYSYQISWIANSRKCKTDFCKRDHQLSRDKFDEPVKFWHFFSFFFFPALSAPARHNRDLSAHGLNHYQTQLCLSSLAIWSKKLKWTVQGKPVNYEK